MTSGTILVINLIISIAIILLLILKLKVNPAISLVIGSLYMGIASGIGLVKTAGVISEGFGSLMVGIGLPIGFGVILGQLLSDCGGAHAIAAWMVNKFKKEKAVYAIGLTAFILSIPVFFDVTFVILIPLGLALAKEINKPLPYIVGAMAIGAGTAHTLVPPTPNPLAAASILHFDLGVMVLFGGVVGLISIMIVMKLYFKILDRGIWNSEKDVTHVVKPIDDLAVPVDKRPSVFAALVPIFLPVVLILLGTVTTALWGKSPAIIQFFGDKLIALLIGVISAYVVAAKSMTKAQLDKSAGLALQATGVVLLITGAGGSFGNVIKATGVGEMLAKSLAGGSKSVVLVIIITYLMSSLFRIAQGSGTVASITTMTIMASVAPSIAIHPVWIALAALSGGISIGHVNDSGFWVVANLSGLSVTGGLKTYTLGCAMVSIMVLLITIIGSVVLPMA